MARIRTVKPETWTDEKIVSLSPFARLLFIGMWNFADDEGRMAYSPLTIKLQVLPADSVEASELLGEIRGKEMIVVYQVDGKDYLQIVNFAKHQKIDKRSPSKLPGPPPNSTGSPPITAESRRIPTTEGKGRERKGREREAGAEGGHPPTAGNGEVVLSIPLVGPQGEFIVTANMVSEWRQAYPGIDVDQQLRQLRQWNLSNPKKRKTRRGILAHITTWLAKEQDKRPNAVASIRPEKSSVETKCIYIPPGTSDRCMQDFTVSVGKIVVEGVEVQIGMCGKHHKPAVPGAERHTLVVNPEVASAIARFKRFCRDNNLAVTT